MTCRPLRSGSTQATLLLVALATWASSVSAVELRPGDLVSTVRPYATGNTHLVVVDGDTGFQTQINLSYGAFGIEVTEEGRILVGTNHGKIFEVDPVTGSETLISQVASNPGDVFAIEVHESGDLIVAYANGARRVDPETDEYIFLDYGTIRGVVIADDGTIFIAPQLGQHVTHVDENGNLLQEFDMDPPFNRPGNLDQLPNGEIVIMGQYNKGLFYLNPANGQNGLISDLSAFQYETHDVEVTRDGRILISARLFGDPEYRIYEIDRDTGEHSLVVGGGLLERPRYFASVAMRPCDDGIDNDGDGQIDLADTGCADPDDLSEEFDCEDSMDNDYDGTIDAGGDPGCASASDPSERNPAIACDDGVDNDGDGTVDTSDPGCDTPADTDEQSPLIVCDNGLDDDGDGVIDFRDDPGCASPDDSSERLASLPCDDGLDNDGDALADYPDDPGCRDLEWARENPACDDNFDNDNDGDADWDGGSFGLTPDPGCIAAWSEVENPACDDGQDNDGDGDIDWDGGPQGEAPDPACISPVLDLEAARCDDDIDNDQDGKIDWDGGGQGVDPDEFCLEPDGGRESSAQWMVLNHASDAVQEFASVVDLLDWTWLNTFHPIPAPFVAESMGSDGTTWVLLDADGPQIVRYGSLPDLVAGNDINGVEPIVPTGFEGIASDGDIWVLFDRDAEAIVRFPTLTDLMNDTNRIHGVEPINTSGDYFDIASDGQVWLIGGALGYAAYQRFPTLDDLVAGTNAINGVEYSGPLGVSGLAGARLPMPVPEPGVCTSLAAGALCVAWLAARRRRHGVVRPRRG